MLVTEYLLTWPYLAQQRDDVRGCELPNVVAQSRVHIQAHGNSVEDP